MIELPVALSSSLSTTARSACSKWVNLMTHITSSLALKVGRSDKIETLLKLFSYIKYKIFEGYFWNFLGISTCSFVKKDPKFENKSLFDTKFYGAWKNFRFQFCLGGLSFIMVFFFMILAWFHQQQWSPFDNSKMFLLWF